MKVSRTENKQRERIDRILSEKELTHSWGIASLCCGIAGLVLFLAPYFGIVLSILAVVFHSKQKKIEPTGVSMGGLVTGIIGIVINSLILVFMLIALLFISAFKGISGW